MPSSLTKLIKNALRQSGKLFCGQMDQNLKSTVENMDAVPLMVWGHYQQHVVRSRCLAYFSKILLNHILHGFGVADQSVYLL